MIVILFVFLVNVRLFAKAEIAEFDVSVCPNQNVVWL